MQNKTKSVDMTVGDPKKLILLFTLPLIFGNIFQQVYSMADAFIVGRTISIEALSAVGTAGPVVFLILGLVQGLAGGFSVVTAQRFGCKNIEMVKKSVAMSIILGLFITVVVTPISYFLARPLLVLISVPEVILNDAVLYVQIIFLGTLSAMFYNIFSNIIRAFGDSRTPLYFLIVACALNVILDFVFILGCNMGVEGASLATVISQGVSAISCLFYMRKKYKDLMPSKEHYKIDLKDMGLHIKVGLPMGLQFSIICVGIVILQAVVNSYGEYTIASFVAAQKVDGVVTQSLSAIGLAMATYTAQNYGAGKLDRIKQGLKYGSIFALTLSIVGGVILFFFGGNISGLFIEGDDAEVVASIIADSVTYFRVVGIFYPGLALLFVYRNVIQGMGNSVVPTLAGMFELVLRAVTAYSMSYAFGYAGVCFSSPSAWIGAIVILIPSYYYIMRKKILRKNESLASKLAVEEQNADIDKINENVAEITNNNDEKITSQN